MHQDLDSLEKVKQVFKEGYYVFLNRVFFCYADILVDSKKQDRRIEKFIKSTNGFSIVLKKDLTKYVQASIYDRLIYKEHNFYQNALKLFDGENLQTEISALANAMGLGLLLWWRIRFSNPFLKSIAKEVRRANYWGNKKFFYYLLLRH